MDESGWIVRPAGAAEVACAAAILEEAIEWASVRGFATWLAGSYAALDGNGRRLLRLAQADGCLHLGWISEEPVATFTLLSSDPRYWPDAPADALYLHRFAVRRAYAGIGSSILKWVASAAVAKGKSYVRLDCIADDPGIRAYYERAGFIWHHDVMIDGELMSLYELPVARNG